MLNLLRFSHPPRSDQWRRHRCLAAFMAPMLLLIVTTTIGAQDEGTASDPGLQRLEHEIARLAKLAGGRTGVGAIHPETGRAVYLNRAESFPMASTYKVPIAVQLLSRIDRGEERLNRMVVIEQTDLHPGSGMIAHLLDDPGVALSIRNLLELMLLISDNSAADLLIEIAGGPAQITRRLRELGIAGVRVDRPTVSLIADWAGIEALPPPDRVTPEAFMKLYESVSEEKRAQAAAAFDADPRDTATPEGMARLLEKVWRREILSAKSRELLLDIMHRCETGANRIKGLLPPGTEVAHKTGTIGGTANDIGIITLPDGAGHVVIVVFVKSSKREVADRERAMAQISRAIYDYFLFNPEKN